MPKVLADGTVEWTAIEKVVAGSYEQAAQLVRERLQRMEASDSYDVAALDRSGNVWRFKVTHRLTQLRD